LRQILLALSLLATLASAAQVAQTRYVPDAPGRWKPWTFYADVDVRRVHGARPVEVKDLEAQLLRLTEIIKKTNGFTNPVGFSPETGATLGLDRFSAIPGDPALTARPLPVSMIFLAFGVFETGSGATLKRDDSGETSGLLFFVNDLTHPLFAENDHAVPEFEKLDVGVVRLAAPQPDVFGMPRYGRDVIVLKKSAAPIWVAVTLAETLELVTRGIDERLTRERADLSRVQKGYDDIMDPKKRQQRIAEYQKIAPLQKDPAFVDKMTKMEDAKQQMAGREILPEIATEKAIVTKSEQDLAAAKAMAAALSAADKAAPACYASGAQSLARFRRAPAAGCDPLVRANWAMFNPALPRSAPQLLTISKFASCLIPDRIDPHVGGCVANKRLLQSIDKAALMAWLQ
jgi:hypothetical protein